MSKIQEYLTLDLDSTIPKKKAGDCLLFDLLILLI